ncbi:MAG TPA: efflux transporter outer membrane subunit [Rhodanobacteraceae bacterium]|nr:efflux transporter outer membrane subunit [Rhodanobacteraceae bacterium]
MSLAPALALLASCAVGPTYRRPAPPVVARYTAAPASSGVPAAPAVTGHAGGAQSFQPNAAVSAMWWRAFESPALDQLVQRALAHNPSLAAADATLQQARFELRATKGVFYPQVSLGLAGERTRTSGAGTGGATGPQLYNLYTGQVAVSYFADVFGASRIAVRGQQAEVDVARAQLDAARLTIAGSVVNTAFELASLQDQVEAMRETVADQRQVLGLTRTRYRLGATPQFEVLTQQSELASSEAELVQLRQAQDATAHLLATLLGEFPDQARALQTPQLASLQLPATLPLSLPGRLVQGRPDIRAAEAQLRAANAQVAEAVAALFPNLEITADFGQQSNHTGAFFDPASRIWDAAAGLVAPLFEGGTLRARKHAAEAAYRAVFADYQGTVLGAFRQVADALRALQHDAALLDARARSMQDAHRALDLVTTQFQNGGVDYLEVLTSETQYQAARIAYVQAEAQRYADTAALYVALGGGRWTDDGSNPGRAAIAPARRSATGAGGTAAAYPARAIEEH